MPRFDDYHRTVIGYHGTGLASALRIVNRIEGFRRSQRDYDWLGRGVYFWEYSPKQALKFARIRQRQYREKREKTAEDERRATEPLAVIACMIRLGFCLDLTEPENVEYIGGMFEEYSSFMAMTNAPLPKNTRKYRKLDCAVFEHIYAELENSEPASKVDTARGVYVPTEGARRVWSGSWISTDTHIQICVRNPANLLGSWLHYPIELEVDDVFEALRQNPGLDLDPANPRGDEKAEEEDAAGRA